MPKLGKTLTLCLAMTAGSNLAVPACARQPEVPLVSEAAAPQGAVSRKELHEMGETLTVSMKAPQAQLLGGPVAVSLTIANAGAVPVRISLPYPNPNNFSFQCLAKGFANEKTVEHDEIERTAPTQIAPGATFTGTYYLNRYFSFLMAGDAQFAYQLSALVSQDGQPGVASRTFEGKFAIHLDQGTDDQVRRELNGFAARLQDPDRKLRAESAEALAFVDSALVVPYLLPMLQTDGLEVIGVHALARHSEPDARQAMVAALSSPQSSVVAAVLEETDRLKIALPRRRVQNLLASRNEGIQWLALNWLSARPDRDDLPFVNPLLDSHSEGVRKKAKVYLESLNQPKS